MVSKDSYEESLCSLTRGVEQLDMAGHRFRTAGAISALSATQIGQVMAGHRHVLLTLTAKVTCMELINKREEKDRDLP